MAGAVLSANIVLYVVMQLSSRIADTEQILSLKIPCAGLFVVEVLSLAFVVMAIVNETGNRKVINDTSIKEAFDHLPTGICFFNEMGLPVLCNLAMQRFSFSVTGADVQYINDLEACLSDGFCPAEGVRKDGKVFVQAQGSAWQLEKRMFSDEKGVVYTQFIALDVTDLCRKRLELVKENEQLRQTHRHLQKLSANVVAITREEEILNAKMRIHDEMGKCLVAAQKYLNGERNGNIPDSLARSWQKALALLKSESAAQEEDMLQEIRKTCEFMKLSFIKTGELPGQDDAAYLLVCAVRECVTNAVRYAKSSELYADFSETQNQVGVTVTNNGIVPDGPIREGGGLSTLRRRIERAGGTMDVQSQPYFKLTVTVPKRMEGEI
jgi:signal transduction histidine kinase